MTGSIFASSMSVAPPRNRGGIVLRAVLVASVAMALQYAAPAKAGGRHGGWFIGGLVVGAALAPRYAYPAHYYNYPARVYYAPPPVYYPPQVVYTAPPVYVQPPPPVYLQAPAPIAAASPAAPLALPIEDRLRRLRSLCEQGLFTVGECQQRREQILQEL